MMDGFRLHNFTHWSASTHNLATNAPDVFIAEKLFGKKRPPAPAMVRGSAIETGLTDWLVNRDCEWAVKVAHDYFDHRFPLRGSDPQVVKERDAIDPSLRNAIRALEDEGLTQPEWPESGHREQHKISIEARGEGWSLPVIGYLDFRFPGLVIDLKSTLRMPSEMSVEHQRQRAIYAGAVGNHAVRFLYVTPKKAEFREDGDPPAILAEIKTQMNRIERFLRLGDRDLLASIVPVNPTSFYWKGNEAARLKLFGL